LKNKNCITICQDSIEVLLAFYVGAAQEVESSPHEQSLNFVLCLGLRGLDLFGAGGNDVLVLFLEESAVGAQETPWWCVRLGCSRKIHGLQGIRDEGTLVHVRVFRIQAFRLLEVG